MGDKNKSLEDFEGWAGPETGEFFNIDAVEDPPKEQEEAPKDKEDDSGAREELEALKLEKAEQEELENDALGDFMPEADTNKNSDKEAEDKPVEKKNKTLSSLNSLVDAGLIELEDLEEGEEETRSEAEIIEEGFEKAVETKTISLLRELPKELVELNKFVLQGGNYKDYISNVRSINSTVSLDKIDLSSERDQEFIVKKALLEDEYDIDDLDSHVKFLKDSGKLEGFAKRRLEKFKKRHADNKEAVFTRNREAQQNYRNQLKENKGVLTGILKGKDSFDVLNITRKEVKEFPSYIEDKNIKLDNGNVITGLQRDLLEVLKSPKGKLQLAKLMRNSKDGVIDLGFISRSESSKATSKIEKNIQRIPKDKEVGSQRLFDIFD